MVDILIKRDNESTDEYIDRVCRLKVAKLLDKINWSELANIINSQCNLSYSESTYRKSFKAKEAASLPTTEESFEDMIEGSEDRTKEDVLLAIRKEKAKLSDERVQLNAYVRQLSREETLKEIGMECAREVAAHKPLKLPSEEELHNADLLIGCNRGNTDAILTISDWHYGADCDNYWNKFNPDIAEKRISKLLATTIVRCKANGVNTLYVVNLSDLISGLIHLKLRVQTRYDVITQTMKVAEILSDFLTELSTYFKVVYYDCDDNHSRITANKKESLNVENFARVIKWYLKERLKNNSRVEIKDNEISSDIITFKVRDKYSVAAVHGDKDSMSAIIKNLSLYSNSHFDLILAGHRHHFAANDDNGTTVLYNGTLMGTDEYASGLRLNSKPSQNLVIVSDESITDTIYKIDL